MKTSIYIIRCIAICALLLSSTYTFSQKGISTAYLYKGYWSQWVDAGFYYNYDMTGESKIGLAGEYDHFC